MSTRTKIKYKTTTGESVKSPLKLYEIMNDVFNAQRDYHTMGEKCKKLHQLCTLIYTNAFPTLATNCNLPHLSTICKHALEWLDKYQWPDDKNFNDVLHLTMNITPAETKTIQTIYHGLVDSSFFALILKTYEGLSQYVNQLVIPVEGTKHFVTNNNTLTQDNLIAIGNQFIVSNDIRLLFSFSLDPDEHIQKSFPDFLNNLNALSLVRYQTLILSLGDAELNKHALCMASIMRYIVFCAKNMMAQIFTCDMSAQFITDYTSKLFEQQPPQIKKKYKRAMDRIQSSAHLLTNNMDSYYEQFIYTNDPLNMPMLYMKDVMNNVGKDEEGSVNNELEELFEFLYDQAEKGVNDPKKRELLSQLRVVVVKKKPPTDLIDTLKRSNLDE
jgi:hypothetical protein